MPHAELHMLVTHSHSTHACSIPDTASHVTQQQLLTVGSCSFKHMVHFACVHRGAGYSGLLDVM